MKPGGWAALVPVGCASLAGAWLASASYLFIPVASVTMPRAVLAWTPTLWLEAWPHRAETWRVTVPLVASAAVPSVPVLAFGFLFARRALRRRLGPKLRPPAPGEVQEVIRGGSDNHGHADWMPMADALRLLRPAPTGEPSLVIGEAYRVDRDRVAGMPFNPRDRATWGQGGTAPLLVEPCLDGPTHSLVFAGSGGLKTSTAVTRLLHWTGSAIVLDPSREIGPMIREARGNMGQAVVELGLDGAGINVLAGIDPGSPNASRRLLSAVAALCGEEPERGENSIFADAGRNLVTCLLAHILWDDELAPELRTLAFFRELVTTPEAEMKRLLGGIAKRTRSTTARLTASTLMGLADDTFSGAYFNATQFTAWMYDDAVVDMLSIGSFQASDVVTKPVTVFVQVPLDVLLTTPAVARVVLDALAWAFIEADGRYLARTLFLVDEASKLGRMKSVEIVRDTGRKYGLTLHMLYLSEAELGEVWGPKGVARWFANLSWRAYAGISDRETAKGLSEDVGTFGVLASSEGDNRGTSARGLELRNRSRGENTSTHEIKRRLMPVNYDQAIDAARLLEVPFFSAHTPTDNLVVDYLNKWFAKKKPATIEDVQTALLEIPEYRIAALKGAGPYLGKSSPGARAGKIWVDMTGGTEGPKKVIEKLADGGVGTIVGMHMGEELREQAEKHNIHVVIAGHMSSDSLGINQFLDELERNGVKTIATSGLVRVHRDKRGKVTSEEPGALPAL